MMFANIILIFKLYRDFYDKRFSIIVIILDVLFLKYIKHFIS